MPPAVVAPPPTQVEPVTEVLHGVEVTDPYRWLEDQNSPRTRAWLEEQTRCTRAYLDAIPGRERIRKRVTELLAVDDISEPWKVGNRYFFLKRQAHQQQPVIVMQTEASCQDVVLVDPALRVDGSATRVSIVNISRDGTLLAYGVKHSGTDAQSVEFLDVPQGRVLPDRLPLGFGPGLVFSSAANGFYYVHKAIGSSRPHSRAVYWHELGGRLEEDAEIFCAGEDPTRHVALLGSADGEVLACLVVTSNDPVTLDLYVQNRTCTDRFHKVVGGLDSVLGLRFVGRNLIALTDWNSPNLRIVAVDANHPHIAQWVDIVPEGPARIKDFAVVDDFICVLYEEKLASRIEIFDRTGHRHERVLRHERGTVRLLQGLSESDTLFYNFSSFDEPRTLYSYCPSRAEHALWATTRAPFDPSSIEITETNYQSKDGARVPIFLVTLRGRPKSSLLPVFLTGYGGFGATITPQFSAYLVFLIELGFLVAIANVRGGGEFGEEWHRAGKRHNRQNAINDFIAAAEWLVLERSGVIGKIAIGGGSNAGLLVGAALTQRPDLFRAVLCIGPVLDMLRYHLFDSADAFNDEYGSPENPEDFRHLAAYSPYHHVEGGTHYPAVMLVSGDADTRCNPMHARKMAARLQAATGSKRPVLLDYRPKWGHTPAQPLDQRIDAVTDRLAFICRELNVTV